MKYNKRYICHHDDFVDFYFKINPLNKKIRYVKIIAWLLNNKEFITPEQKKVRYVWVEFILLIHDKTFL